MDAGSSERAERAEVESSHVSTDRDEKVVGTTGEVIDVSDGDGVRPQKATPVRAATKSRGAALRGGREQDVEVESDDKDVKGKRKRGRAEQESSDGEDGEERDELASDGNSVPNKGLAPKGGQFDYAERVLKFCAFAWSYASLWGSAEQALVLSMISPLARLETKNGFEVS